MKIELLKLYARAWNSASERRSELALVYTIRTLAGALTALPMLYLLYKVITNLLIEQSPTWMQLEQMKSSIAVIIALGALNYLTKAFFERGLQSIALKQTKGEEWHISEIYNRKKDHNKFLGVLTALDFIIFVGSLLFYIVGIIFEILFYFATFIVIDEKTSVIDAFKRSKYLTGEDLPEILINTIFTRIIQAILFGVPLLLLVFGVSALVFFKYYIFAIAGGIVMAIIYVVTLAIFSPPIALVKSMMYEKIKKQLNSGIAHEK